MKKSNAVLVLIVAASLVIIIGCEKKAEPTAAQTATAAATEQTICPVMNNPINKDIFVEYKGKKVYFCCKGCIDEFNKDPEKYVSQLPQFKQ